MTAVSTRLRNSIAYRSGALARWLLALRPPRYPRRKQQSPHLLLTFAGAPYRVMLEQFLYSLARSWASLPRVAVALDRDEDEATFRVVTERWPGSLQLVRPRDVADRLAGQDLDDVLAFARREVVGRKLAAVVAFALDGAVLYADVDVLWFGDGGDLYELDRGGEAELVISEDYQASYDPRLVPVRLSHLASPPFLCAGIMLARGQFLRATSMRDLLPFLAESGVFFTEQTILAESACRLGRKTFSRTQIYSGDTDRFTLSPTYVGKEWIARHYVNPVRHLLWRDALALRCGIEGTAAR